MGSCTEDSPSPTPPQRALLQILKSNPGDFISRMERMEKDHRDRMPNPVDSEPVSEELPESTERLLELCDDLIRKMSEEAQAEQEQFVKQGLCAVCGQKPISGRGQAGRTVASRPKPA